MSWKYSFTEIDFFCVFPLTFLFGTVLYGTNDTYHSYHIIQLYLFYLEYSNWSKQ